MTGKAILITKIITVGTPLVLENIIGFTLFLGTIGEYGIAGEDDVEISNAYTNRIPPISGAQLGAPIKKVTITAYVADIGVAYYPANLNTD